VFSPRLVLAARLVLVLAGAAAFRAFGATGDGEEQLAAGADELRGP
jgi:hypothetical protein